MNAHPLHRRTACVAMFLLGCSSSTQNTSVTTPTPTPAVDAAAPMAAADASAAPTTPTAADAAAPMAAADVAPATPTPAPLPAMPENLHGPTTPWARMNAQQRGQYMAEAVMPVMTTMLHDYDSTRYAQVTCATCHGANARAVHFRMPNGLPALPPFGSPAATAWHERDPRMFQFMGERIVPAMARLLGREPFNMQTHQGFGCLGCHPHGA